MRNNSHSLT